MRTVTIPFHYFDLPYSEQQKITPICIPACDKNGKRIAWGWFEAASRVEERLRSMTRRILQDERLVSEVAEGGVHNSWHAHGENFSRSPEGLVVRNAGWHALNMRAGGRRERQGKIVALEDLGTYFQQTLRIDPTDYAAEYNNKIDYDLLADELAAEGYEEMSHILDLMQQGSVKWSDIAEELGEKPDAVRKRIRRWLSKRTDLAERILLAVTDSRRYP